MTKRLAIAVGATVLVGCTVSVPQYDAVRNIGRALTSPAPELPLDEEFAWVLELNELETLFFAVQDEDGTTHFSNLLGARLDFDGWDLVSGQQLPNALRSYRIDKRADGWRVHDLGDVGRFEMVCAPPAATDRIWTTLCEWVSPASGEVHSLSHRVSIDEDGMISRIETELVPGARPMVFRRLVSGDGSSG